jgi:hypothetical protein
LVLSETNRCMQTDFSATLGEKVIHAPNDQAALDRFADRRDAGRQQLPERMNIDADKIERDLARLVLGIIELLRQLLERQAIRRVESGRLSEDEIERLGETLLKLEARMSELKQTFGLSDRDLSFDLGPLRDMVEQV